MTFFSSVTDSITRNRSSMERKSGTHSNSPHSSTLDKDDKKRNTDDLTQADTDRESQSNSRKKKVKK